LKGFFKKISFIHFNNIYLRENLFIFVRVIEKKYERDFHTNLPSYFKITFKSKKKLF